jgi:hypothetical protein
MITNSKTIDYDPFHFVFLWSVRFSEEGPA